MTTAGADTRSRVVMACQTLARVGGTEFGVRRCRLEPGGPSPGRRGPPGRARRARPHAAGRWWGPARRGGDAPPVADPAGVSRGPGLVGAAGRRVLRPAGDGSDAPEHGTAGRRRPRGAAGRSAPRPAIRDGGYAAALRRGLDEGRPQPSGLVWHQDQLPASAWLEDPAVRDRRLTQGQLLANHRRQGTAAQLGRHRRERACRLRL
jgi:hypothetical protein